jgi:hypothetical protein
MVYFVPLRLGMRSAQRELDTGRQRRRRADLDVSRVRLSGGEPGESNPGDGGRLAVVRDGRH